MALRLASATVITLDLGDGDWLKVPEEITKRVFNALVAAMPMRTDGENDAPLSTSEALEFQTALFTHLACEWSMDIPCTTDNYLALDPNSASRIDVALAQHFASFTPTAVEAKKASTLPA